MAAPIVSEQRLQVIAASRRAAPFVVSISLVVLGAAWCCDLIPAHASLAHAVWLKATLAGVACVLCSTVYALRIRHRTGRLLLFGKGRVLVRSLDDWTEYQYNVPFEQATAEQQSRALDHYKVGDRLFPARPVDEPPSQRRWQRFLSLIASIAFITVLETIHGPARIGVFLLYFVWLWLCFRWSKQFQNAPAHNSLTGLDLTGNAP